MKNSKIKLGISHGDINGISYEIMIKTLMDNRVFELCTPVIYGSPKVAAYHRKALNINNFALNNIKEACEAHPKRVNMINCVEEEIKVELGKSTSVAGKAAFLALKAATTDLKNGDIDVLLTAPINKKNIQSEEFNFPGHTEYLETITESKNSLMLMVSEELRLGLVSGHVPISKVPETITKESILGKLEILNLCLLQDFGIQRPKIAVLSLNPHSGDDALIGTEEQDVIIPALEEARKKRILTFGPFAADGFFGSDHHRKFDAVLAMYHDQGLAPFKALSFDSGVNFTAGLPLIRTSPAHGTAYSIAGENIASETSFRKALYLALDVYRNRQTYKQLNQNPLHVENR